MGKLNLGFPVHLKYLFVFVSWSKRRNTTATNMYNSVTIHWIEYAPFWNNNSTNNNFLSITIQNDFGVCILYTTFYYTAIILKTYGQCISEIYFKCLLLFTGLKSLGIHCLHLKVILRISRFRIIVTHQDKAEDNNKLQKYNITRLQNRSYIEDITRWREDMNFMFLNI